MGGENYLQAAAGGRSDIPAGVFRVERREGGPDLHFRCDVESLEEVAEVFRRDRPCTPGGYGRRSKYLVSLRVSGMPSAREMRALGRAWFT